MSSILKPHLSVDNLTVSFARNSPLDLQKYRTRNALVPHVNAPHLDLINDKIVQLAQGKFDHLMVFVAPRQGKSELCSISTPAWWKGTFPWSSIIITSWGQKKAQEFSGAARNVLEDVGKQVFGVEVSGETSAKDNWQLEGYTGTVIAAGVGGGIMGWGANLAIIDDPIANQQQAVSATYQESNWQWYASTLKSRLEPGGKLMVVMQRWHKKDLAGMILEDAKETGEHWEVVNLPEIAEDIDMLPGKKKFFIIKKKIVIREGRRVIIKKRIPKKLPEGDDGRRDILGRKVGDVLWPARWSKEAVYKKRRTTVPFWWASQHQGRPRDAVGKLFKEDMFVFVKAAPRSAVRVRYWDLAATEAGGDYMAGCLMSFNLDTGLFLIEDMIREQFGPGKVKQIVKRTAKSDGSTVRVCIEQEPGASGKIVIDDFRQDLKGFRVRGYPAGGPKMLRHQTLAGGMENQLVFCLTGHWNRAFVAELTDLPGGEHDDQADAASGAYGVLLKIGGKTAGVVAIPR